MRAYQPIIDVVLAYYLEVQAIYLFGYYDPEQEWSNSDVAMALLLPPSLREKRILWRWSHWCLTWSDYWVSRLI